MQTTLKFQKANIVMLIIFIAFIPLTFPDALMRYEFFEKISFLYSILIFLITVVLTIKYKRGNLLLILILGYYLWRISISYLYLGGITDLVNSFKIITLIILLNFNITKFPKSTFSALSALFSIYIYINFITLYIFPNGMYLHTRASAGFTEGWFLGISNQFSYVILPGLTLIILNSYYRYGKIRLFTWITMFVSFLSVVKIWSATAVVSVFLIIIFTSVLTFRKKIKFFNFKIISIVYIILFIAVLNIEKITPVRYIVIDLLDKDLTLSYRTIIWEVVINAIKESLIFGYGINTTVVTDSRVLFYAHNLFLQISLDSGLIGLILFLSIIFLAGRQLQLNKNNPISFILLLGIFTILVGGLTESYRVTYLLALLIISYNVNYILYNKKKSNYTKNNLNHS